MTRKTFGSLWFVTTLFMVVGLACNTLFPPSPTSIPLPAPMLPSAPPPASAPPISTPDAPANTPTVTSGETSAATRSPMPSSGCMDFTIPPGGEWEANRFWFDTGIVMASGQMVSFTVSGTVRPSADYDVSVGPEGTTEIEVLQDSQTFISDLSWPFEVVMARIDEHGAIKVGNGASWAATWDGTLQVGVNDTNPGDNEGSFEVGMCW